MRTFIKISIVTSAAMLISAPSLANDAANDIDIAGTWYTQGNQAKVLVADCGDGTPCGTMVWFDPAMGGENKDFNNPDPELRGRPLLGSAIFWGFERKKNKWKSGYIYDARGGKTYKSKLELQSDGSLKVKGCIGPICQGQTWIRAEDDPAN